MDMYAEFVDQVNPKGYVIDYLMQHRIVSDEVADQLRGKKTRHDCCRTLLHELQYRKNPKAFIILREAIKRDYAYIVEKIDEGMSLPAKYLIKLGHTYIFDDLEWSLLTTHYMTASQTYVC